MFLTVADIMRKNNVSEVVMSRQVNQYEKVLFDLIKDHTHTFYYTSIYKTIDETDYKIKIEKQKEEMVGRVQVILNSGEKLDYEIRYNRLLNVSEGYTLFVPGTKAG